MKCKLLQAFLLLLSLSSFSQTYQATWESLDQRPTPQWFRDAKFGIFIHWGVYSVPGFTSKGNYAEWYQHQLEAKDSAVAKYHHDKFGNKTYYQLADDFKAELFNPDDWAKLFEQSGAKYIVLTSKHHDGFALWPSKETNKAWGFPWTAVSAGPKRDLLGDLFKAVRKTPVHAGMYYSLYEWYNPLWKQDKKRFAAEHTWPQMKDLIQTYQPDVFWTDGDWEATDDVWKSKEFLAWMYNESPVKDKIVVNDRWGDGIRFKHAGIYTPEYQPDLDFEDHYWEESRGMGFSYGYNRAEDAWDYNSAQSLVLQLIDKVSRGGNFLLDIGPDEHGKIPPVMQERLLQIGDWLTLNGEAIYGTSRWKTSSQWSEGNRNYKNKSGDMLLKITVDPDPGYAVKEVFYTYNANTNSLYAILPTYPENGKLVLTDIAPSANTTISLLSTKEKLSWQQKDGQLVIDLPAYNPNKIKSPYAFAVKINGYGKFVAKPVIKVEYKDAATKPVITLMGQGGENAIRYTTDNTGPTISSTLYSGPFAIDQTTTIKAAVFSSDALPSSVSSREVIRYKWMNAVKVKDLQPGISYKYYQPAGDINMATAFKSRLVNSGVTSGISISKKQRTDKFAFDFEGYINIAKEGVYTFYIQSDDGSKLFIDETEAVDNDGDHGPDEKEGKLMLKKGFHKIQVRYFDSGGGNTLNVSIQPEGGSKVEIPAKLLFH